MKVNLEKTHICVRCGREFIQSPDNFFYQNKSKSLQDIHTTCKQCHSSRSNSKTKIKKIEKRRTSTPERCNACHTRRGNIIADKNGYLCMPCTKIVKAANRNLKRLQLIITYLEKE